MGTIQHCVRKKRLTLDFNSVQLTPYIKLLYKVVPLHIQKQSNNIKKNSNIHIIPSHTSPYFNIAALASISGLSNYLIFHLFQPMSPNSYFYCSLVLCTTKFCFDSNNTVFTNDCRKETKQVLDLIKFYLFSHLLIKVMRACLSSSTSIIYFQR